MHRRIRMCKYAIVYALCLTNVTVFIDMDLVTMLFCNLMICSSNLYVLQTTGFQK